jgi:proline iminopeptidase
VIASTFTAADAQQANRSMEARDSRVPAGPGVALRADDRRGKPFIVLHGGPDFDHGYLLPDVDRLKDAFQLVYYDQRGRGMSANGFKQTTSR